MTTARLRLSTPASHQQHINQWSAFVLMLLEVNNMSQRGLAARLGMTHAAIHKWANATSPPKQDAMQRVAFQLEIPLWELQRIVEQGDTPPRFPQKADIDGIIGTVESLIRLPERDKKKVAEAFRTWPHEKRAMVLSLLC